MKKQLVRDRNSEVLQVKNDLVKGLMKEFNSDQVTELGLMLWAFMEIRSITHVEVSYTIHGCLISFSRLNVRGEFEAPRIDPRTLKQLIDKDYLRYVSSSKWQDGDAIMVAIKQG